MEMKNQPKFVLSRPAGGLNDSLCMVQSAWSHCDQSNCHLVVDVSQSWMAPSFKNVFQFPVETVTVLSTPEEVARFEVQINKTLNSIEAGPARKGGNGSLALFGRITVGDDVLRAHRLEHLGMGAPFDAVHIRHSDYKTDFRPILRKVGRLSKASQIRVLTDSNEVLQYAREVFGDRLCPTRRSLPPAGTPLHKQRSSDQAGPVVGVLEEAVLDILIATKATRFFYTHVLNAGKQGQRKTSGFGGLIVGLRKSPHTLGALTHSEQTLSPRESILVTSFRESSRFFWTNYTYPVAKRVIGPHFGR